MKKSHSFYLLMALCTGLLTFSGCSKPKDGLAGPPGNANVQTTIVSGQGLSYIAANFDYELTINDASITQAVMDKGLVVVYAQPSGSTSKWYQLPGTVGGSTFTVAISVGQAQILSNAATTGTFNWKVVVVPAAIRNGNPGSDSGIYSQK